MLEKPKPCQGDDGDGHEHVLESLINVKMLRNRIRLTNDAKDNDEDDDGDGHEHVNSGPKVGDAISKVSTL